MVSIVVVVGYDFKIVALNCLIYVVPAGGIAKIIDCSNFCKIIKADLCLLIYFTDCKLEH